MSMVLPEEDRYLFFGLLWRFLFYASEQLEFLPRAKNPVALSQMGAKHWIRLREALYRHPTLFDSFTDTNPYRLTDEELAIVRGWKQFHRGRFFIWRYLKKYTVFLSDKGDRALGVIALNKPFELMLGPPLPVAIETVLLPFKDRIVYDGLFSSYPIRFGPGIKRLLNESYRRAKAREGVITSFAQLSEPVPEVWTEDDFELRYWSGFAQRLPYKLDKLNLVTQEHIRPDKRAGIIRYIRKNRMMRFPDRMGLEEGFDPIQVEVLELVVDGKRKRIEVLNRAGAMFLAPDPAQLTCFHRFVHELEETLPPGMRLL